MGGYFVIFAEMTDLFTYSTLYSLYAIHCLDETLHINNSRSRFIYMYLTVLFLFES